MQFEKTDITGCRLIGAITKLGYTGPKHHGIVIGRYIEDGEVYVAENCHDGYKLSPYPEFLSRYSQNEKIQISPNTGEFSDKEVAQRALNEVSTGGKGKYNLVTNNCESFSNRAMHGKSVSSQVVNTVVGLAFCVGAIWLLKKTKVA